MSGVREAQDEKALRLLIYVVLVVYHSASLPVRYLTVQEDCGPKWMWWIRLPEADHWAA